MLRLTPDSAFAHRGLHDEQRQRNSLSAIVAAGEAGYGVEFDVHLSADGVPFISHDPNTVADTGVDLEIGDTHSGLLRELRFRVGGERLATLDDVVAQVPPQVPLLVELKPTQRRHEVVVAVQDRLQDRGDTVAVQSFDPRIVAAARRHMPGFAVGQLCEAPNPGMRLGERLLWATQFTNAWVRPHFLAVYLTALDLPATRRWRQRLRCPLLGWTVADEDDLAACRAAGAGVIFDRIRP